MFGRAFVLGALADYRPYSWLGGASDMPAFSSRDMETLRSTPEPWGYQTLDSNIVFWRRQV